MMLLEKDYVDQMGEQNHSTVAQLDPIAKENAILKL